MGEVRELAARVRIQELLVALAEPQEELCVKVPEPLKPKPKNPKPKNLTLKREAMQPEVTGAQQVEAQQTEARQTEVQQTGALPVRRSS